MTQFTKHKNFKCLPFLATLFMMISISAIVCKFKLLASDYSYLYGVLCSINFVLLDMIAEVYGFEVVANLFWSFVIARIIFLIIYATIVTVPPSTDVRNLYIFEYLLDRFWWIILINPFLILIVWYINAKLFMKLRMLFCGKYFWLRSTGTSGFVEMLFIILLSTISFIYHKNTYFYQSIFPVFGLIFQRVLTTALIAYPAGFVVNILKLLERNEKNEFSLNPFKTTI